MPNARSNPRKFSINEVILYALTDENNISVKVILNGEHNIKLMFPTAVTSVYLTIETIEKNSVDLDQSGSVRSLGSESSARFGGAVLLDDDFVARHKLIERLEAIGESELKDSYGNVFKTKKLVLPAFSLGHAKLKNIPISVFEGAIRNQKMSVIGSDVLKRFHIVFDFRKFETLSKTKLAV